MLAVILILYTLITIFILKVEKLPITLRIVLNTLITVGVLIWYYTCVV